MATAPSLFGATPEELRQQQAATLDAQAMKYAEMDPFQRATYGIYKGANQLGGVLGGMMGGQDPQMAKASTMQQIASQHDASTPDGLLKMARAFAGAGFNQEALQASQAAQAQQLQMAQMSKSNAEAAVITTKAARDAQFTAGMAALPKDATDEDRLALAMSTGSQADVLKTIELSRNKEAARTQAVELAKSRAEESLQRLREQGANQAQISAAANASREGIAAMMIAMKNDMRANPVLKPMLQKDENTDLESIDKYTAQQKALATPIANLTPNANNVRNLELGPIQNARYSMQNAAGNSTPQSLMYENLKSAVDTAVNIQVSAEKGVQTDGDVLRFAKALIGAYGRNDSAGTLAALKRYNEALGTASSKTEKRVESRRSSQKVESYGFGDRNTPPAPPSAPAAGGWGKAVAQ